MKQQQKKQKKNFFAADEVVQIDAAEIIQLLIWLELTP
jgi:hypothetical protein